MPELAPRSHPPNSRIWWAVLALAWYSAINQLRIEWSTNPQYNFGWSVPFLCLYLIIERLCHRPNNQEPITNNPLPTPIFHLRSSIFPAAAAAAAFLPLRLFQEANPGWRAVSWAIALNTVALTLAVIGLLRGHAQRRHLAFPILFFLIAVPWPTPVEAFVIQGFTRLDASLTVEILNLLGTPAMQHGNVIEVATGVVGIDEACSGIRSFQATLMVSLFLGEYFWLPRPRRWVLLLAGVILAFGANVIRTYLLTSVAAHRGIEAIASWHDPAGFSILLATLAGLLLLALALKRRAPSHPEPSPNNKEPITDNPLPTPYSLIPNPYSSLALAILAWLVLSEVGTRVWYASHETGEKSFPWSVRLPVEKPTYRDLPITQIERDQLRFDKAQSGLWIETDGKQWDTFVLEWKTPRTLRDRVILHDALGHRPEICLTGSGLQLVSESGTLIIPGSPAAPALPFRRLLFDRGGQQIFVYHCVSEEGQDANLRNEVVDWTEKSALSATRTRLRQVWLGRRYRGLRVWEIVLFGYASQAEADTAFRANVAKLIVRNL